MISWQSITTAPKDGTKILIARFSKLNERIWDEVVWAGNHWQSTADSKKSYPDGWPNVWSTTDLSP